MAIMEALTARMIDVNQGKPALVHHLLKVHAFARTIGMLEGIPADTLQTLELAALTHDIAIGPCMDRHGHCTAEMQQTEGPPLARRLLLSLDVPAERIDRICYLIAHHHEYTDVDGIDYRILLEADFLVNALESNMEMTAMMAGYENVFETDAGRSFFKRMYLDLP